MTRALRYVGLVALGLPWVLAEAIRRWHALTPQPKHGPLPPIGALCPACQEPMDGMPHFHDGRGYFPTANPRVVVETSGRWIERP